MSWSRRCPHCRHTITKEEPWEPWYCVNCGWIGGDDVSPVSEQKSQEDSYGPLAS